jgi:hypothetical protein
MVKPQEPPTPTVLIAPAKQPNETFIELTASYVTSAIRLSSVFEVPVAVLVK